jgi:heme oxygenase
MIEFLYQSLVALTTFDFKQMDSFLQLHSFNISENYYNTFLITLTFFKNDIETLLLQAFLTVKIYTFPNGFSNRKGV